MAESSSEAASSSNSSEEPTTVAAPAPSGPSPGPIELEKPEGFIEPERKRRKLQHGGMGAQAALGPDGQPLPAKPEQKLEHRLGGILCCVVCFDLPCAAVYQVLMSQY